MLKSKTSASSFCLNERLLTSNSLAELSKTERNSLKEEYVPANCTVNSISFILVLPSKGFTLNGFTSVKTNPEKEAVSCINLNIEGTKVSVGKAEDILEISRALSF